MDDELAELNSLLDGHAELEARFKELEDRVDLEEMKAEVQWAESQLKHQARSGQPPVQPQPGPVSPGPAYARAGETVEIDDGGPTPQAKAPRPAPEPPRSEPPKPESRVEDPPAKPKVSAPPSGSGDANIQDPTAALKARLAGKTEPLFLVVLCPSCGSKNRTSLDRLRSAVPRCGRCGGDLTRHR